MGEYIDDFEQMEAEIERAHMQSCYTCEHRDTPIVKAPCRECWNRSKWKKRKDGEK